MVSLFTWERSKPTDSHSKRVKQTLLQDSYAEVMEMVMAECKFKSLFGGVIKIQVFTGVEYWTVCTKWNP